MQSKNSVILTRIILPRRLIFGREPTFYGPASEHLQAYNQLKILPFISFLPSQLTIYYLCRSNAIDQRYRHRVGVSKTRKSHRLLQLRPQKSPLIKFGDYLAIWTTRNQKSQAQTIRYQLTHSFCAENSSTTHFDRYKLKRELNKQIKLLFSFSLIIP